MHNPLIAVTSKDLTCFPIRCCENTITCSTQNTVTTAKEITENSFSPSLPGLQHSL